jgi:hypothetical protein
MRLGQVLHRRLILWMVVIVSPLGGLAQDGVGNWLMYFGEKKLDTQWSLHTEAQLRLFEVGSNPEQLLLRTGVNYRVHPNYMVTAGYGFIRNYNTAPQRKNEVLSDEHRIWQQLIIRNRWGKANFEHRYRLEQRSFDDGWQHRARYRLMVTHPIYTLNKPYSRFLICFYNELFMHLDAAHPFDRNRLYGAMGYQFDKDLQVQLGLLNQTTATTARNYLQLAFFYTPTLLH